MAVCSASGAERGLNFLSPNLPPNLPPAIFATILLNSFKFQAAHCATELQINNAALAI